MIKRLTLILALLFAQPAWAAIAILDAPADNEQEDCDPCAANFTISAGTNRIFMCAIAAEDQVDYDISGVTFNAVAMSLAAQAESPTNNNIVEIWYMLDANLPAPGAHSVSVNFTESVIDFGMTCWSVSGAAQTTPKATDVSDAAACGGSCDSTLTATLSLAGIVATDWTFTAATHNAAANTWAHGAGQTEMSDFCFGQTVASGCMGTSRGANISAPESTTSGATGANRFAMVAAAWAEAASTFVPMGGHAQQID